jgi:diguanylate cyclase (GGDEF)-like protein
VASAFLLAATGLCVRHPEDVSPPWMVAGLIGTFLWLFLLIRIRAFSQNYRFFFLVGTTIGLNLLAQGTGGSQSPLTFSVFLLMGVAAWDGEAKFGFGVAILFSLLEALSLRKEDIPLGWALYLRWAVFLVSAIFLAKVVKTRAEKEQLGQRLDSLKHEAVRLAASAEPASFNVPKDKLLREESRQTARVGTVMELDESLENLLSLFQKAIQVHTIAFFQLTTLEGKKVLRLQASASESHYLAMDVTLLPGETLVGLSAKEGRRVLLNQVAPESAKALPYYLKPNPVLSFLAQPVYLKNQGLAGEEELEMAGVLVLDSNKFDFFTPQALDLVEQFMGRVAQTIHGTRVLHFSQTKTRNLHALNELSNSFSALLDPDAVREAALNTVKGIFNCDSAYVAQIEGDEKTFKVWNWWASSKTAVKPARLEEELAKWVLENKKPIRFSLGQKDKSFTSFMRREGMLGSTQSFLMVPLLVRDDTLGVIRLNSGQPETYQSYDQDVLTTIANQTAMALENALMVQQIREMSIRDGLTGLYNHRYFQEKLNEEMVKAGRYNKDLSLLLLDVDHFKKFNDTYGHQEGDKVLRIVSEVVQSTVRTKVDTACRYGGEEFAVILPESDVNVGKDLAERIRKNIASYIFENTGKNVYHVTVSIGLACYPFDGDDPKKLIHSSDQALYAAKSAGRNCVKPYKSNK